MKESTDPKGQEASVQRDRYLTESRKALKELSRDVDDLEESIRGRGASSSLSRLLTRLKDVRNKERAVSRRLDEIGSAPLDEWRYIKAGADMAIAILAESYEELVSRSEAPSSREHRS